MKTEHDQNNAHSKLFLQEYFGLGGRRIFPGAGNIAWGRSHAPYSTVFLKDWSLETGCEARVPYPERSKTERGSEGPG